MELQSIALPTELSRLKNLCAERDLNPHERYCSQDFKFCASADFAIRAFMEAGGFEPPNPKERIYSPPQLAALLCFRVTLTGFEPVTTYRISALTTFAPGQNNA